MPIWSILLLLVGFLLTIALLLKWAGSRTVGSLFIVGAIAFVGLLIFLRIERLASDAGGARYGDAESEGRTIVARNATPDRSSASQNEDAGAIWRHSRNGTGRNLRGPSRRRWRLSPMMKLRRRKVSRIPSGRR